MTESMRHRTYGGSSAERTIHCPGWINQSADIPSGPPSEYAAEGTALHAVMEEIIVKNMVRDEIAGYFTGSVDEGYTITSAHIEERILPAYDAWTELKEKYSLTDWEPEVECSYADDIGGYSDVIAANDSGDVFVIDWKFGYGILVSPVNSHQGRFYGVAARKNSCIKEFFEGAKRFHAVIIQPNDRGEDVLKVWTTTIDALDEYEEVILNAVAESKKENPALKTGSHCKWCPAAPVCPEKTGKALWALRFKPDDLEQLANNMAMVGELSDWIKTVESTVIQQLETGAEVKGWKLVAKRAVTRWIDENEVLKKLRRKMGGKKNLVTEKLLSPAQLLKAAKALDIEIDIEPFIERASSGTTLAPADDKRPAVANPKMLAASLAAIE